MMIAKPFIVNGEIEAVVEELKSIMKKSTPFGEVKDS